MEAPWKDYKGRTIHSGNRIRHPDGKKGTVTFCPWYDDAAEQWRVIYDCERGVFPVSRLLLQVGDKGQAEVVSDE